MAFILILLITLLSVVDGIGLSRLAVARLPFFARFCAGSVVGLAVLTWTSFLLSLIFGLNSISITATIIVLAAILVLLIRLKLPTELLRELKGIKFDKSPLIYRSLWFLLLVWLFSRVVMFYPDGLHTAPANNFGDLPFHFSVITSFAYGENIPPQNPIFAGMKFTYPFLIDFLTAFFVRCGADWRAAFFIENIILSLSLVGLIDFAAVAIFKNRLAGLLAPVVFLFNGGLGFVNFFRDLGGFFADRDQAGKGLIYFLTHLPNAYTMNAELSGIPLRWGNVFTTLLIPQRSMLFGLPFAVMIITLWALWRTAEEQEAGGGRQGQNDDSYGNRKLFSTPASCLLLPASWLLLFAGILAGMMPMLHAHGFLAVMLASVPMALLFRSRSWIAFFIPAILLAAPQALWLSGTPVKNRLKLQLWWEAGESNPLAFWAANAGILILILIVALIVKKVFTPEQRKFYLPFVIWFLIPNAMLLAPWAWDNIKMFVYWGLATCLFVAAALARLFESRFAPLRVGSALLVLLLTFSGGLDVIRALSPVENTLLFSREDLEAAKILRERLEPRSILLHAPIHNSVAALAGRQSMMGYPGHLWTHGIDYIDRETDLQKIYAGGAESLMLLAKHKIDYLLIGPVERSELNVDEAFFSKMFPLIIDFGEYKVYRMAQ